MHIIIVCLTVDYIFLYNISYFHLKNRTEHLDYWFHKKYVFCYLLLCGGKLNIKKIIIHTFNRKI